MNFEWDDDKNQRNFEKHKIRFEEAVQIFRGPTLTTADEREDYGELREISVGQIRNQVYLVLVHTDRDGTTRMISARKAKRHERKRYDDYIQEITR